METREFSPLIDLSSTYRMQVPATRSVVMLVPRPIRTPGAIVEVFIPANTIAQLGYGPTGANAVGPTFDPTRDYTLVYEVLANGSLRIEASSNAASVAAPTIASAQAIEALTSSQDSIEVVFTRPVTVVDPAGWFLVTRTGNRRTVVDAFSLGNRVRLRLSGPLDDADDFDIVMGAGHSVYSLDGVRLAEGRVNSIAFVSAFTGTDVSTINSNATKLVLTQAEAKALRSDQLVPDAYYHIARTPFRFASPEYQEPIGYSRYIYKADSAEPADGNISILPNTGVGRFLLEVGEMFDFQKPFAFDTADGATIGRLPGDVQGNYLGLTSFVELTDDSVFSGGTDSAIGFSSNMPGATAAGSLLGGAGGLLAADLGPFGGVKGLGKVGSRFASGSFWIYGDTQIKLNRIASAFTAGSGFFHLIGLVLVRPIHYVG